MVGTMISRSSPAFIEWYIGIWKAGGINYLIEPKLGVPSIIANLRSILLNFVIVDDIACLPNFGQALRGIGSITVLNIGDIALPSHGNASFNHQPEYNTN